MKNSLLREDADQLLHELLENLDITKTQWEFATSTYQAVGNWLADDSSLLSPFKPEILPQGSFALGTMIKPIQEADSLDVDLVCRLHGKDPSWTQKNIKDIVGDRLKSNETYRRMLDKEGRRCWTLNYQSGSNYHLDILPALATNDFELILEKAARTFSNLEQTAISITDNGEENYPSATDPNEWPKSNPFGYKVWFQGRCRTDMSKSFSLAEAIKPFPTQGAQRYPLQKIVQILKRHRDIRYSNDDDKPISIILTTLAAQAYSIQPFFVDSLLQTIASMEAFIEEKYDEKTGTLIKWVGNPVGKEGENFADKWPEEPRKEELFFDWLNTLKEDSLRVQVANSRQEIGNVLRKSLDQQSKTVTTTTLTAEVNDNLSFDLPDKPPTPKREGFA